ncbi:hypothetical protein ACE103_42765 [Bradyrhizobium sp. ma5]|uniref:rolling circle replication-associated protein n=1 Tax=Bradyrhizobium sp. ma5 TaxID=3344828 RepID=UPI0035D4DB14
MPTSLSVSRDILANLINAVPFENPVAVTLTMKKRARARAADDIVASANLRLFRVRLETRVLGRAAKVHGKRLRMVCVLEMSADYRLHYHCILERPYHCSFERFAVIIRDQWSKTDFGYHEVDIQDRSDAGWTDYLLKLRQKRSLLDSIDWTNCYL